MSTPLKAMAKEYVVPAAGLTGGLGGRLELGVEGGALVAHRLEPRLTQNRLAQPLQAEQQQEHPDDDSDGVDRQRAEPGAKDDHHSRQEGECGAHAGEGGGPAAGDADRQNDGESLDALDRAGEEHRSHESQLSCAHALNLAIVPTAGRGCDTNIRCLPPRAAGAPPR